jgi:CDP-paratose 2-epimerase
MGRVDQGVVALWTGAHVYGRPLTYIGYEGKQVRDLLHVEDVADLVLRQVKDKTAWDGRVYNVGGGTAISVSLRELTQLAETATGNRIEIREDPAVREGDVPLYITDAAAVMKAFEWSPQRDVEAIVRDTADWLLANKETLHPVFCG